jgi:cytochrome b561
MYPIGSIQNPTSSQNSLHVMSHSSNGRHPLLIRFMHWLTGIIILGMITTGLVMVRMDDTDPWKYDILYVVHQSVGIVALLLINMRLFIRLRIRLQALPSTMSPMIVSIANGAYCAIYALMLSVPLTGLAMSAAYPQGQGLVFFAWTIPTFLSPDDGVFNLAKTIHWLLAYAFACLILLHGLAALRHRFFDRPEHNVLARML